MFEEYFLKIVYTVQFLNIVWKHFNFLKSCTLFDRVSASRITRAARFWSLKTFSMLFTEEDVHLTMAL